MKGIFKAAMLVFGGAALGVGAAVHWGYKNQGLLGMIYNMRRER